MVQDAALQLKTRLVNFSPYFRHLLNQQPPLEKELFLQEGYLLQPTFAGLSFHLEQQLTGIEDFQTFCQTLRRFKQKEILRLAARDLAGINTFSRTVQGFSDLALVCLKASLRFSFLDAAGFDRNHSLLRLTDGLVVLALGKLGGEELNFSSDIDLVFLFRPVAESSLSPLEQKHFLQNLIRRVIRAMGAPLGGDRVFRVDLDLRPGGKDSELVLSVDAVLDYFQNEARPWERMAWIKARPVAGNLSLGMDFLRQIEPVIYRKFLDYTVLSEIRSMKEKMLFAYRSRFLQEDNVKLGPGGIREVEFIVQALQVIFGGKIPSLRERNTLKALGRLKRFSILPETAFRRLSTAYRFLRTLEHRLQMVHQQQIHALPRDTELLSRIARETPFRKGKTFPSAEALQEHLDRVREGVRQAFEDLLSAPGRISPGESFSSFDFLGDEEMEEARLVDLGFRRPQLVREILLGWRKRVGRVGPRRQSFLKKSVSLLFRFALETPDADQSLILADTFLHGAGFRTAVLALLAERVSLTRELMYLFAQSRMVGRLFAQNPEMIDHLFLQTTGGPFFPRKEKKMTQRKKREEGVEEKLASLRRWKSGRLLNIAWEECNGRLAPEEVAERLSDLADRVLQETLILAQEKVDQEVIRPPFPGVEPGAPLVPLGVLGLGRLGGREMSYLSDMDLIFIYSLPATFSAVGRKSPSPYPRDKKKVTPHEYLVRLAQRLISYLSLPLKEGPGYSVDTRLRPSGRVGPLIVSLEAFTDYYREQARNWEKQALLKARIIAAPPFLVDLIETRIRTLLFDRPPNPLVREEMVRYRLRMEKERSGEDGKRINPKLGFGGLTDIEFITQYLQWIYGGRILQLREGNTLRALQALKDHGCLSEEDAEFLREAYQFLVLLDHALQLVYDRRGEPRTYLVEELRHTASMNVLGLGQKGVPGWDIVSHYQKVTLKVRALFKRILERADPEGTTPSSFSLPVFS